jgi:hypothetical protein
MMTLSSPGPIATPRGGRTQRIGWLLGWYGALGWVAVLAFGLLAEGRWGHAFLGEVLLAVAALAAVALAPWRRPGIAYRTLMMVPWGLVAVSTAWAAWAMGGIAQAGLGWWCVVAVLALLAPFVLAGGPGRDAGGAAGRP